MFGRTAQAVGMAFVLLVAACSDDDDTGAPAASVTEPTAPVSTLPPPSGEPIVLALISQEGGIGSLPEARLAAEAAVSYVNSELGGAGGRPFALETCTTDGTPERSSSCANQLLEHDPVAFVGQVEFGTAGSVPIITAAGVPIISPATITPDLLFSEVTFAMGLDLIPGWSGWTKYLVDDLGFNDLNLVSVDFAGAPIIRSIVTSVSEANGGSVGEVTLFPPSATDVSPQMASVIADGPDAIVGVASAETCVPLMQARASLAADVPFFLPGICADSRIIEAAGDSADGIYIGFSRLNPYDTSDPEVATFRRALDTYASEEVALSEFASNAFAAVMNLKALIGDPGGEVTPESLLTALRATQDQPNFMGDAYSCDGHVELSPATCANGQRMLQVADGELVDVGGAWFDGTDQATLG